MELLVVLLCVLVIAGYIKVFLKLGLAWWVPFIPFYNYYKLAQVTSGKELAKNYLKGLLFAVLGSLLMLIPVIGWVIGFIADICLFIITVQITHQLSLKFKHDVGYTIGLLLLPYVFFPMLGFMEAEKPE